MRSWAEGPLYKYFLVISISSSIRHHDCIISGLTECLVSRISCTVASKSFRCSYGSSNTHLGFAPSYLVGTRIFISEALESPSAPQANGSGFILPRLEDVLNKSVGQINKCRCKSHPVPSLRYYFHQRTRNSNMCGIKIQHYLFVSVLNREPVFFCFVFAFLSQCSWSACKRHTLPSMGMTGELHTLSWVRIKMNSWNVQSKFGANSWSVLKGFSGNISRCH